MILFDILDRQYQAALLYVLLVIVVLDQIVSTNRSLFSVEAITRLLPGDWPKSVILTGHKRIHLFILSDFCPPTPSTLVIPGLVDDVRRGVWRTPGVGGLRWLEGCVLATSCAGRLSLMVRTAHPGDVYFSQGHCYFYPVSLNSAML